MIEALGNIGDFVGGIGVVVTLLYLAVQIRASRLQALAWPLLSICYLNRASAKRTVADKAAGSRQTSVCALCSQDQNHWRSHLGCQH